MPRQKRSTEMMGWRPMKDIDRAFDEIEETFEDVFGRPFYPVSWGRTPEVRAWSPPMEIYETENMYAVRMELPGVGKEDIDIAATEDSVTISGRRLAPEGMKEGDYVLCERCYGTFERTITFPTDINTDDIEADFENGILEIDVPKVAGAVGKKIEIGTGSPRQIGQGRARATAQTGIQTGAQIRRGARVSRQGELEKQAALKESRASAEAERAAFKYEQTKNPVQEGTDVHGELPGQTGDVGEMNRSGRVRVVQPGERVPERSPAQRSRLSEIPEAPGELPGQTGDIGDEGPESAHMPSRGRRAR